MMGVGVLVLGRWLLPLACNASMSNLAHTPEVLCVFVLFVGVIVVSNMCLPSVAV